MVAPSALCLLKSSNVFILDFFLVKLSLFFISITYFYFFSQDDKAATILFPSPHPFSPFQFFLMHAYRCTTQFYFLCITKSLVVCFLFVVENLNTLSCYINFFRQDIYVTVHTSVNEKC